MSLEAQANAPTGELSKADFIVLDVLLYLQEVWRRKWVVLAWAFTLAVLIYAYSYREPKIYLSTVKFIPPTRSSGLGFFSMTHSYGDEYRAMLTSNTVSDDVVQHQHLMDYFKVKDPDVARRMLQATSRFDLDANGFVTISVFSKEPDTSARIANEFYAALNRMNERLSINESEHRLNFVAGPMMIERQRLAAAEDALRAGQEKTGFVLPSAQASLGVQQVAGLRQRISDLEAQLAVARVGATDQNPTVVNLRSQISNLQGQIASLQSRSSEANSPANLPELSLQIQRLERDVQTHASMLDSLSRTSLAAQTMDSYTPSLSLIDPAIPDKNKVAPQRKKFAFTGLVLGLALGLIHVLGSAFYRRWVRAPRTLAMKAQWKKMLRENATGASHGN